MIITKDMLYGLLIRLNERLREDHIKESMNICLVPDMIRIKRISVCDNKTKTHITVSAENEYSGI